MLTAAARHALNLSVQSPMQLQIMYSNQHKGQVYVLLNITNEGIS